MKKFPERFTGGGKTYLEDGWHHLMAWTLDRKNWNSEVAKNQHPAFCFLNEDAVWPAACCSTAMPSGCDELYLHTVKIFQLQNKRWLYSRTNIGKPQICPQLGLFSCGFLGGSVLIYKVNCTRTQTHNFILDVYDCFHTTASELRNCSRGKLPTKLKVFNTSLFRLSGTCFGHSS